MLTDAIYKEIAEEDEQAGQSSGEDEGKDKVYDNNHNAENPNMSDDQKIHEEMPWILETQI